MADALWMRIREVDWSEYPTSNDANMPALLRNLASRKLSRAVKASQQIWSALCSGGILYPAVRPTIPFLVEIFSISDPSVQDTIIDIFQAALESDDLKNLMSYYEIELNSVLPTIKDKITKVKLSDLLQELK